VVRFSQERFSINQILNQTDKSPSKHAVTEHNQTLKHKNEQYC